MFEEVYHLITDQIGATIRGQFLWGPPSGEEVAEESLEFTGGGVGGEVGDLHLSCESVSVDQVGVTLELEQVCNRTLERILWWWCDGEGLRGL